MAAGSNCASARSSAPATFPLPANGWPGWPRKRQAADSALNPAPYPAEALRVAIRSGKLPPEGDNGRRFPPTDISSL